MATLRLFAAARDAAGAGSVPMDGLTVGAVLANAVARFGPGFADVLANSKVWLNGDPADADTPVDPGDEVAVLPPVSGGSE